LNFSFLELLKFMLKNKTNPNYEVSLFYGTINLHTKQW